MNNNSPDSPLKVVWICHFSNQEIRDSLPLNDKVTVNEYASWIANTLMYFQGDKSIQLFVVAPHKGLKRLIYSFQQDTINYTFFKSDIPLIHTKLWKIRGLFLNRFVKDKYMVNKLLVKRIVDKISPDIIHLQGAENPRYSSTILQFKNKYPTLVTIQGFISHTQEIITKHIQDQINIERRILTEFSHFGIRTKQMGIDIQAINPEAILHWHRYALKEIHPVVMTKKYDLVFFARICRDKGIEDLIKALGIVCRTRGNTTLIVIGSGDVTYVDSLKQLSESENVSKQISWLGFLGTQEEVHSIASEARVSVLPTYHDIIPGTIIESMMLGIPVVSYDVGGIPELNEGEERVIIVKKFDISALADGIIRLLEDSELSKSMSIKAKNYANARFSNTNIKEDIVECYYNVIKAFHNKQ